MGETFTPQELEQFFALASEANELGVRARNDIEDLRIRQEQLSGYAYSETISLSEEVGKLSELVGLCSTYSVCQSEMPTEDCATAPMYLTTCVRSTRR